jgi:hypothetical protein
VDNQEFLKQQVQNGGMMFRKMTEELYTFFLLKKLELNLELKI